MTTKSLLRGVVATTFEDFVGEDKLLPVANLYSFLEASAKNLSELMLHQTLLEQEAFRASTQAPEHRESMHHTIARSKLLFEKFVFCLWLLMLMSFVKVFVKSTGCGKSSERDLERLCYNFF